jgi:hypothetical protein
MFIGRDYQDFRALSQQRLRHHMPLLAGSVRIDGLLQS